MASTSRSTQLFVAAATITLSWPLQAQDCVGFTDNLQGRQTSGTQNDGQWTDQGWKAINNNDYIIWTGQRIGNEGRFEFEVTGLGPDQPCGECMLWWFAANENGDSIDQLKTSAWAASGRRFGPLLDDPPQIDKSKMKVWCSKSVIRSPDPFEWKGDVWYRMSIVWQDEWVEWWRRELPAGPEVLLSEFKNRPCAYTPENDGATSMALLIGSNWSVASQAVFRNVSYTPLTCAEIDAADADSDADTDAASEAEDEGSDADSDSDADAPADADADADTDSDSDADSDTDSDSDSDSDTGTGACVYDGDCPGSQMCTDGICTDPTSAEGSGCGCSMTGPAGAGALAWLAVLAWIWRRTRAGCRHSHRSGSSQRTDPARDS